MGEEQQQSVVSFRFFRVAGISVDLLLALSYSHCQNHLLHYNHVGLMVMSLKMTDLWSLSFSIAFRYKDALINQGFIQFHESPSPYQSKSVNCSKFWLA